MNERILACDFGTSYGKMAYMDADGSIHFPLFPARFSNGLPMLFMYNKDGEELVCDQVDNCNGQKVDPAAVFHSVKMALQEGKPVVLNKKQFTPKYMYAAEAQRLKDMGYQYLAKIFVEPQPKKVVIPIPVRTTAATKGEKREIHQKCFQLSNISMVDEPTCAALAYQYICGDSIDPDAGYLVEDTGAGTTDIAFLTPGRGEEPFEIHNPMGISIGGDAFDAALFELVLRKLRSSPGSLNMQNLEDKNHFASLRLLDQCRTAKERLSDSTCYPLDISDCCGGYQTVTVTREEYEDAINHLVTQIVDLAEQVANACKLGPHPKMNIVLSGGSAHTPLLQKMMRERFPWVDERCFEPRLAPCSLAMGAVLYGAREKKIVPKTAYGYALEIHQESTNKDQLFVMIPPNTGMPCKISSDFLTLEDNGDSCHLRLYEVNRGFTDQLLNMHEGIATEYELQHKFPHAVPRHTEITLTVELTQSGILTMTAQDKLTGTVSRKSFTLSNMDLQNNQVQNCSFDESPPSSRNEELTQSEMEEFFRKLLYEGI